MTSFSRVSSGIRGLDEILNFLQSGDNVVMQVDNIEDYRSFVLPYVRTALENGERVVYMRFARHEPLLEPASGEIASLLFALQAALGAGVIGYWLGCAVTRDKLRKQGEAREQAPHAD